MVYPPKKLTAKGAEQYVCWKTTYFPLGNAFGLFSGLNSLLVSGEGNVNGCLKRVKTSLLFTSPSTCNPGNTSQPRCLQLMVPNSYVFQNAPQKKNPPEKPSAPIIELACINTLVLRLSKRGKGPKKDVREWWKHAQSNKFKKKTYTLPETPIFRLWKSKVGRCNFLWGWQIFRGHVGFKEGKSNELKKIKAWTSLVIHKTSHCDREQFVVSSLAYAHTLLFWEEAFNAWMKNMRKPQVKWNHFPRGDRGENKKSLKFHHLVFFIDPWLNSGVNSPLIHVLTHRPTSFTTQIFQVCASFEPQKKKKNGVPYFP